MSKPPKIVIPGMNRGAGVPPGYVLGRPFGTGKGPVQLLNLANLRAGGVATTAGVVASTSQAVSTAQSGTASLSAAVSGSLSSAVSATSSLSAAVSTVDSNQSTSLSQISSSLSGAISSTSSLSSAVSTVDAGKANLAGGNSFTGNQLLAGDLTLMVGTFTAADGSFSFMGQTASVAAPRIGAYSDFHFVDETGFGIAFITVGSSTDPTMYWQCDTIRVTDAAGANEMLVMTAANVQIKAANVTELTVTAAGVDFRQAPTVGGVPLTSSLSTAVSTVVSGSISSVTSSAVSLSSAVSTVDSNQSTSLSQISSSLSGAISSTTSLSSGVSTVDSQQSTSLSQISSSLSGAISSTTSLSSGVSTVDSQQSTSLSQISSSLSGAISSTSSLSTAVNLTVHPGYIAGNWYSPVRANTFAAGAAPPLNSIRLLPFTISKPITISDLGARVTTLFGGGNFQLAIYANNAATGRPTGNALCSTGNISTGATGPVSATVGASPPTLAPGTYWMAINQDNSTAVYQTISSTGSQQGFLIGATALSNVTTGGGTGSLYLTIAQTFGTWPDLTSAAFTESTNTNNALVFLKAA